MERSSRWSQGRRFEGMVAGWAVAGILLSMAAVSADSAFGRRSGSKGSPGSAGSTSVSRSNAGTDRGASRDSNRPSFERRASPSERDRSAGRTPSFDRSRDRGRNEPFAGRRDGNWNNNRPRSDRPAYTPGSGNRGERDNIYRRSEGRDRFRRSDDSGNLPDRERTGAFRRRSDPAPGTITDGKDREIPSKSVERTWGDLERSGRIGSYNDRERPQSNRPTPSGVRGRQSGTGMSYPRAHASSAFERFYKHEKKIYRYRYNDRQYVHRYYYPNYCTAYDPYYTFPALYFSYFLGPYPRYVYRDRVVVVERPVYISDSDDDDDYYLSDASRELDYAIEDIRKAWTDKDVESLMRHVRVKDNLRVYFKGEYNYSISPEDYYNMTLDAVENIDTLRFDVDRVVKKGTRRAYVYIKHDYEDQDGERSTLYVSYLLERYQGEWWITAVGSSTRRTQWYIH
ncbi:MAG: hypothetical protein IT210_11995 [Armatimonadetes bacterium]|nr:hypothetical protein [Armatimonadota bacterium]